MAAAIQAAELVIIVVSVVVDGGDGVTVLVLMLRLQWL